MGEVGMGHGGGVGRGDLLGVGRLSRRAWRSNRRSNRWACYWDYLVQGTNLFSLAKHLMDHLGLGARGSHWLAYWRGAYRGRRRRARWGYFWSDLLGDHLALRAGPLELEKRAVDHTGLGDQRGHRLDHRPGNSVQSGRGDRLAGRPGH